jgi:hypothetical protein
MARRLMLVGLAALLGLGGGITWGQDGGAATSAAAAPAQGENAASATATKGKKGKAEYTGPNTVMELAPTPILDAEGKQQLDPDGKPMFNPPVKQQRDKKGHPLFDEQGKPVMQTATDLGYDEHGKKIHARKEKAVKTVSMAISRGTLTVDGMTGKAALNYEIADLKYLYVYAPGIGTAVVSNAMFPGATEQATAFDGHTLTVTVADHTMQVYSDEPLLGKGKKKEPAYVLVDREFVLPSKFPVVGFGTTRKAPYAWPGAKANAKLEGPVEAPPLPKNLLPVQLLAACPAGQMRMAGPAALPGEVAKVQPCVPIVATAQR